MPTFSTTEQADKRRAITLDLNGRTFHPAPRTTKRLRDNRRFVRQIGRLADKQIDLAKRIDEAEEARKYDEADDLTTQHEEVEDEMRAIGCEALADLIVDEQDEHPTAEFIGELIVGASIRRTDRDAIRQITGTVRDLEPLRCLAILPATPPEQR